MNNSSSVAFRYSPNYFEKYLLFTVLIILAKEGIDTVWGTFRMMSYSQNSGVFYNIAMSYVRVIRPLEIMLLTFISLKTINNQSKSSIFLIFLGPILIGTISAFYFQNKVFNYFADFTNLIFGGLYLLVGINLANQITLEKVYSLINKYIYLWVLPCTLSAIWFFISYQQGMIQNPTFSAGKSGILFLIGFYFNRHIITFLASLFLIGAGQRALLLSLIASMIPFTPILIKKFSKSKLKFILPLVIVSVGAILSAYLFSDFNIFEINTLNKFKTLDPKNLDLTNFESREYFLNVATSGRWPEIKGAFVELSRYPSSIIWGKGLGATYTVDGPYKLFNGQDYVGAYPYGSYRNVHLSYLGILLMTGTLGLAVYVSFPLISFLKSLFLRIDPVTKKISLHIILLECIFAVFGFNYFQDSFLWLLMGLTLGKKVTHSNTVR